MQEEQKQEVFEETENTTEVAKCPVCGANMEYSPNDLALKCPYCGSKKEINFGNISVEQSFGKLIQKQDNEWGKETHIYRCNNCGASEVLNRNEIAKICPFCGTTNVVEVEELSGVKPNGVVPFLIDVKVATEKVIAWAKKKLFAPIAFKRSVKPEGLNGVYSPAFTFDTDTASSYKGRLGKHYTEQRRVNGKTTTVTKTRWFRVHGNIDIFFDDILVHASSKIGQQTLDKLQPFDTNKSQQYSSEFLHGFVATATERTGEEAWDYAKRIIDRKIREAILARYSYDVVDYLNVETACSKMTYKYLLLPLYIGHCHWKSKLYNFYVNGHNGKVTGKTPLSVLKVGIVVLVALVVVALIVLIFFGGK